MRMLLRWLPIVLAAIVGGFGSATLYPLAWRAVGAPMNGLAGIGAVLIGFAGAVFCGFGAMAPWKAWSGWFRDPQFIGIWAMMLLLLLILLINEIPEWRSGRWHSLAFSTPFSIGSFVVGALIRFSFDGVVWLYGLLVQHRERLRVSNSSVDKCL